MVTSLRLASQQHHSSALPGTSSGGPGGQIRSLSEDRATSHPSPPPPFRGRNSSGSNLRPLTRSSRVEEIPDIYWEQAARELDFCTCRKCQVGCFIYHYYEILKVIHTVFLLIFILNKGSLLNKRDELLESCRHRRRYILASLQKTSVDETLQHSLAFILVFQINV